MKLSRFKTDDKLENEGVWIEIGEGCKLKIARFGNPHFLKYLREITKPYEHQIRNDTIDPDLDRRLMCKVYARTILLDWEGIEDDNGKQMKYTEDNAVKALMIKDFFDEVKNLAKEREIFAIQNKDESEKN